MFDLKPYGAFIENTIRPLIQELKNMGFPCGEDFILMALKDAIHCHIISTILTILRDITCLGIVAWTIFHSGICKI